MGLYFFCGENLRMNLFWIVEFHWCEERNHVERRKIEFKISFNFKWFALLKLVWRYYLLKNYHNSYHSALHLMCRIYEVCVYILARKMLWMSYLINTMSFSWLNLCLTCFLKIFQIVVFCYKWNRLFYGFLFLPIFHYQKFSLI